MAYNTPETVADYLARFQMEITHRGKGTFTPDHVKYSLTIASGGKDFFTTFESNPHVHGEPTITQVFGALASDAMVVRDYGMDEFVGQGNVFADCEIQKVWDENGTLYLAGAHHDGRVSVEMRQLTDEGERLWGQLDYEDYLPLEGLTAMGKHYELGDENQFIHDLYNSPELCAAPRYVEQSFGCPSEEYEKEEGTRPHDFTTGKWRVHLIYPGERYGLDGCLTYELNAYSGAPAAAHRASYPLVEFYDTSQDAARFPGGQFVSRYYMTDLLEDDSIAVSLDTMLKNGNQFSLDGGIPAWTVEGDDLAKVNDFLKKSCMEFCGSLPGDEKDEDGYSLSGEAKDATASRNGLSRNQMGIEEKAAECKEAATVLANGNAL